MKKGFTIVEIIVGIAVTGLFISSLTVAFTSLTTLNDQGRDLVSVNGIAEAKIESLRSANFVALTDGTVDFTDELPTSLGNAKSGTYTVATVNDSLKQVTVEITYSQYDKQRTNHYSTYIGELGIAQ